MSHRGEAGPSGDPGDTAGCGTDTLHGFGSFRMHINGRAISCVLILICLNAQREKARCPSGSISTSSSPSHPALILRTNSIRELSPLALEPRSLSCGAAGA